MKRKQFWDARRNEFFIDRHRPSFQAVLYYYQSGGRLRRPIEVPEDIFLEELEFYMIGDDIIKEYKLKEGFIMDEVKPLPSNDILKRIWLLVEEPDSSKAAKVFAIISVTCILVSIINFCLETLPSFERPPCVNVTYDGGQTFEMAPNYTDAFFVIETICVIWFTIEFMLRLISCPSKWEFCKNIMNIFDVMAILPYFITLVTVSNRWKLWKCQKEWFLHLHSSTSSLPNLQVKQTFAGITNSRVDIKDLHERIRNVFLLPDRCHGDLQLSSLLCRSRGGEISAQIDTWRLLVGNCNHDNCRLWGCDACWSLGQISRRTLCDCRGSDHRTSGTSCGGQFQ